MYPVIKFGRSTLLINIYSVQYKCVLSIVMTAMLVGVLEIWVFKYILTGKPLGSLSLRLIQTDPMVSEEKIFENFTNDDDNFCVRCAK